VDVVILKLYFIFFKIIKKMIQFILNLIHILPDDIQNYITIIISRNPYKRLVSGFLDKYKINGNFRHLYKHNILSFSKFIDELIKNNYEMINRTHFTPQTTERFDRKILQSKIIKIYDLENIDYNYIQKLYNIKIPLKVMNKKYGHERSNTIKKIQFLISMYMI